MVCLFHDICLVVDERLERSSLLPGIERVSLPVTLWLSGIVVDWTFTSEGVDVHARLFVDHHRVNNLFMC